ncbi:hypothetical protein THAOC_11667 [Thalassiosira oceanica]|uniref:Rubredoxin-like domain-containing protein n=1 Tax=Thalassiosira oceanica TaxID=159749 RepID=K0SLZ7_THAOC|nr:hypothetical protein THAOC_11667 [Thalassiosira oceanica]|eukprot:EJK67318.1 hypothetical protein THAOC_11667 [Thalassiosira oceanica]
MKFSSGIAASLLAGSSSCGVVSSFSFHSTARKPARGFFSKTTTLAASTSRNDDFESILGEGSRYQEAAKSLQNAVSSSSSSPVIRVPDGSPAATVTLASAVAASDVYGDDLALEEGPADFSIDGGLIEQEEVDVAYDPLKNNAILRRQHDNKLKRQQKTAGIMKYVKNPYLLVKDKDFADVTITVLLPGFLTFLAVRQLSRVSIGKMDRKANELYEQGALDITALVGNFDEIEATYNDYKKKLFFNGAPSYIATEFIKRLAIPYFTTVGVSPKSVRENPDNFSVASRALFYSEHVFTDKAAKKKFSPLIKQLTRMCGGVEEVMAQQKDMAEGAYRDAVADAGPGQTKITEGWKAVGLDKEKATEIFEETKKLGFLSRTELWEKEAKDLERQAFIEQEEAMAKLRASIDKDGNWINPDDDVDPDKLITDEDLKKYEDDDDSSDEPTSGGAKECGKCGYTMFIAPGREGKFFSSSFTCPQCGAGRDQFKDVDIEV